MVSLLALWLYKLSSTHLSLSPPFSSHHLSQLQFKILKLDVKLVAGGHPGLVDVRQMVV